MCSVATWETLKALLSIKSMPESRPAPTKELTDHCIYQPISIDNLFYVLLFQPRSIEPSGMKTNNYLLLFLLSQMPPLSLPVFTRTPKEYEPDLRVFVSVSQTLPQYSGTIRLPKIVTRGEHSSRAPTTMDQ